MIKIKGEGTSLDWQIINGIKDVSVKNIEFKNVTFECETITDASGNLFEKRGRGKWIDYTEDGYVECPFCHSATNCDGDKEELHFCFSCGADMRGEQHE